jgi:RIO-like serine/threonine protein kinase
LETEEIRVLRFIAKHDHASGVPLDQIAGACSLKPIEARHFASKLEERSFIEQATRHGQETGYFRLTRDGREYVVKNQLL